MRRLPLERVAETREFVRGMAIVRGEAVPVVDARCLLDGEPTPDGRFVSVHVGARRVALLVDDVLGVRVIPADVLREVPPLLGDASAMRTALGALDGKLLELLDAARLVPPEAFGAEAGA